MLAGTIIRIIPIPFVIFVIVEFHALNDVIAEPNADIRVRVDVALGVDLVLPRMVSRATE